MPFGRLLCAELGADCQVPILIDCVNRYQAIAEREKGIADGARNFIIIDALDEGIGSGIVLHGELLRGSQSISREIGHLTVNPIDGPECICGARGCLEAMVSAKRVLGMAAAALTRGGWNRACPPTVGRAPSTATRYARVRRRGTRCASP